MWIDAVPVQREWNGGRIMITDVLYEYEGPVVFRATVGLNDLLFAKRDEGDVHDFFVASETDDRIIEALKHGRLSLRGALDQSDTWLMETDLAQVSGYQCLNETTITPLLPQQTIGLFNRFGAVPDTLEQAEAFISFRFLGEAVQGGRVSLSVLQDKINDFAKFVRKSLTPPSLIQGRDYRFFDLDMAEPKFSSLVLAAKKIEFDAGSIASSRRLQNVTPDLLLEEAGNQGRDFWILLRRALEQIERTGGLSDDFIIGEQLFLNNLDGLIPDDDEGLSRVEITFNDGLTFHTAVVEGESRRSLVAAQKRVKELEVRRIVGVITEVNGEAGSFIIKDLAERQTTCTMMRRDFDALDVDGSLRRGRQVSVTGQFTRRVRRDALWIEEPVIFLN